MYMRQYTNCCALQFTSGRHTPHFVVKFQCYRCVIITELLWKNTTTSTCEVGAMTPISDKMSWDWMCSKLHMVKSPCMAVAAPEADEAMVFSVFVQIMSVLHMPSCTSGASLGCTAFAIKCTAEARVQRPCCTSGAPLGCTAFAIKCTVETVMYSTSGAPLRCTAFSVKCTAYSILFIRSLAWVYCICQQVHWIYHQVYCISCHVNQEPHLVSCICQQVYCICHHVHQEPHLGVLHLPSSVLHVPSSNIRSNTGVYYISRQVYCRGHAVLQEPHLRATLGCTTLAIKCTAEAMLYYRSPTWVYCMCYLV